MSSRSPAAVSSGLPLVHRFALLVGVFIAALAVLALWGGKTLQEVRVNGPLYERVVQGKDLVADILPPPVYILESYLVAMQTGTATSKEEIERFSGRLDALQKEYATRHDYWKSRHLEAELHTALLERAHAPVNRFFELARSDYLPALIAGRRDDARKALDAMGVAYTEHRSAIDKAVELANKRNEIAEQAAAQTIASNLGVMALLFAATLAASVVLALLTTRKVLRDLGGEPGEAAAVARAVAQGDLGTEIKVKAGDTVSIMAALRAMQDELKRFVGAQTEMARQHEVGEIDHAMPSESFSGVYHDMAASVNALAKSHIALSMRVVDVVAAYARGDLAARMEDLPGKKARVSAAMNAVRESLKSINGEIQTLVDAASRGEFGVRGDETKYEHDFRRMICALNRLMAVSEAGLKDVARVLGAMARGDLTQRIAAHYEGTFDQLKNDTHRTAESLARIVASIRETTESITTASKEIAQGNAELSSRTEEQASSLEETASSMEELTSTVKQNAENAQQANRLAVGASEVAVKGGAVVDQVVATVGSINESSRRIVDIIAVIDGIAFQTNILALNAAVEAARAGEQGRGFAVVATEVRNLAQRSAAAAKEIKALISDSVDKVGVGSKLVAQAGETMAQVVESIKRVSDIVAEITVASQEQSAGIVQINEAINRMDEGTQQNAALVEQAAAAAESLQEQASGLSAAVAKFQLDADAGVPVPVRDVASFASGVETTTRANTGRSSDRMRAEAVLNTVEMHSEPMLTGTDGAGFYRACRNS